MHKRRKLRKLVLNFLFEPAYSLIENYSTEEKWDIISKELYRTNPSCVYAFLRYLTAIDKFSAEWEYYCFVYLVYCNPFFDDSMRLAAWHLRKAIEIERNIEYSKQVLSVFYTYPVQYFSNIEFLEIAKEILYYEHENLLAQTVITQLS